MLPNTTMGNYFKPGDWHDNLFIPQLGDPRTDHSNTVKFLFQPGNLTGYAVVCALLLQSSFQWLQLCGSRQQAAASNS